MDKEKIKKVLLEIKRIKEKNNIQFIDTHIHPYDVMGAIHYSNIKNEIKERNYFKGGILEKLKYNKLEKVGSRIFFKFFPKLTNKIIKKTYNYVNQETILKELDINIIDRGVLLPVEPWLPTDVIGKNFSNDKFMLLGSLDVNSIDIKDIENKIDKYITEYKIVGLKLHPNLQNFKPQPSHNSSQVSEKLKVIYSVAEKNKLYLLFHGGISNYTNIIDLKYNYIIRSRTNALLKNFCDENGKSEIFGKYNIPIVIAHLGHYGVANPNYNLVKVINQRFDNVYFDTAGVSPSLLKNIIRLISSKKIIFGSDALYNKVSYNIYFLYLAVKDSRFDERTENILLNILGHNYLSKILKKL